MSLGLKNFLKTWVPVATLLVALFIQSGKIISGMNDYAKELHGNTLAISEMRRAIAEDKIERQVRRDKREAHEAKQDGDIESIAIDVAKLKTLARIAAKDHNPLQPVTDHCAIYRDALVCDEPKSRMSLK